MMKRRMKKLSILLAAALVLTSVPVSSFGAEILTTSESENSVNDSNDGNGALDAEDNEAPAEGSSGSEEAPASEAPGFDMAYIGEFVDEDGTDCTLEIAPGEEAGQYVVQLSIFRLTSFDDGVGVMTEEGLQFTATDAAEQPITAVITLDGENATVKFTDSKWDLIENGAEFVYKKTSEIPQLIQY